MEQNLAKGQKMRHCRLTLTLHLASENQGGGKARRKMGVIKARQRRRKEWSNRMETPPHEPSLYRYRSI